jgi:DNA polymerase-1
MPNVTKYADVVLISDYPNSVDDSNRAPFSSHRDTLLDTLLYNVVGFKKEEVYKTYLVKCSPYENKVTNKEIQICGEYLVAELKVIRPKALLLLGDVVCKALLGVKVSQTTGEETISIAGVKTPVVATYGVGYARKTSSGVEKLAYDMQKAQDKAYGNYAKAKATLITRVETIGQVEQLIEYVKQTKTCCFDFETTSITDLGVFDPQFAATALSVSFQEGGSWVMPLFHFESPFTPAEAMDILTMFGKEVFSNRNIDKIGHNIKYDMQVCWRYGIRDFRGRIADTMLMHHLWDEDARHGLKEVSAFFFPDFKGYEADVKKFKNRWHEIPLDILVPYAGADTDLTLRVFTILESYLLKDDKLYTLLRNLVMYSFKALFDAELNGMRIDRDKLYANIDRCKQLVEEQEEILRNHRVVASYEVLKEQSINAKQLDIMRVKADASKGLTKAKLETNIKELERGEVTYYEGINFNSPTQLGNLLYSKDGFKFKKTWDWKKQEEVESTGKDILAELKDKTGFIAELLVYRSLSKILSTYLLGLENKIDDNGFVHTSFLLHGTETGRLSSRKPNLQNIPNLAKLSSAKVVEAVKMIKEVYIPRDGNILQQADYAQVELRVIADFANDTTMLTAYKEKKDIHAITAAKTMGLSLEAFYKQSKEDIKRNRTKAKAVNFGLIYGMSAESLVDYSKSNYGVIITLAEAVQIRKDFFSLYNKLLDYHATYIGKGVKFGYVRTLLGRKRHVPMIEDKSDFIRGMDERVAINSPIQGTAGELTIFALALLRDRLPKDVLLVNTVHDSIILDFNPKLLSTVVKTVRSTCENLPLLKYFGKGLESVSLAIDIELSDTNWLSLKPYEE